CRVAGIGARITGIWRPIFIVRKTVGIAMTDWLIATPDVEVQAVGRTHRISARPSGDPTAVVSRSVIAQPALFITFHACEAVTLPTVAAEAALAVGEVLLAIYPASVGADDEGAGSEMIVDVKLHGVRGGAVAGERRAEARDGDAALV